jgi:hypothetical protein
LGDVDGVTAGAPGCARRPRGICPGVRRTRCAGNYPVSSRSVHAPATSHFQRIGTCEFCICHTRGKARPSVHQRIAKRRNGDTFPFSHSAPARATSSGGVLHVACETGGSRRSCGGRDAVATRRDGAISRHQACDVLGQRRAARIGRGALRVPLAGAQRRVGCFF